ncbi:MAG: CPBP family intramembrane metalloprotease [Gammaproteobacteria bacterium]|nr:CPBP family intramembrane metalloprotease [Gammaproteobacteria bacterium]MBL6999523.1 CPBP family intramembrane metalloprotease [Gammaproteobacteria bacterium]
MKRRTVNTLHLLVLVLLVSPFYLNDFASIYIKDWHLWLFIDYVGVKFFPLMLITWLILSKKMRMFEFGLIRQSVASFVTTFVILTLVGTLIDQNGYTFLTRLPGYSPLGYMPTIDNPAWNWIDLMFGLMLVGVLEELVFRAYMYTFLIRFTHKIPVIITFSALAFGLIHWSLGLHAVLITSLIGAVFMFAYIKTRALPPLILAHFVINFIDFSGVIPKSIFQLQ